MFSYNLHLLDVHPQLMRTTVSFHSDCSFSLPLCLWVLERLREIRGSWVMFSLVAFTCGIYLCALQSLPSSYYCSSARFRNGFQKYIPLLCTMCRPPERWQEVAGSEIILQCRHILWCPALELGAWWRRNKVWNVLGKKQSAGKSRRTESGSYIYIYLYIQIDR